MKQWIASSATADGARDALSVEILSRRQLKFFIGWRLKSISAASRYKINAIFLSSISCRRWNCRGNCNSEAASRMRCTQRWMRSVINRSRSSVERRLSEVLSIYGSSSITSICCAFAIQLFGNGAVWYAIVSPRRNVIGLPVLYRLFWDQINIDSFTGRLCNTVW